MDNETITAINEITEGERWSSMAGYEVLTDKQRITLMIDNESSCCERWGYFFSEDDVAQFVGAQLLGIELTDTALKPESLKANDLNPGHEWFEGSLMFVTLNTSKGPLQFVAYNEHNGYYGHEAKVTSQQLTHSEVL